MPTRALPVLLALLGLAGAGGPLRACAGVEQATAGTCRRRPSPRSACRHLEATPQDVVVDRQPAIGLGPTGALAYDARRGRFVLCDGTYLFEWNESTWVATDPVPMPASESMAMTFDSVRRRMLLSGVWQVFARWYSWLALHDGRQWSGWSPDGILAGATLAFDRRRGRAVTFGGRGSLGVSDATAEWDGTSWLTTAPRARPTPRYDAGMAYDEARGVCVLFGGVGTAGNPYADTWVWDGRDWRPRFPATAPAARGRAAVAYDRVRQRVVMYGGQKDRASLFDTWEWDGSNWLPRASAVQPRIWSPLLAADDQGRLLLAGTPTDGGTFETWTWGSTGWVKVWSRIAPSPALAFDDARGRLMAFGSGGFSEWDGERWSTPSSAPAFRAGSRLAYDPVRRRGVYFGGTDATGYSNETWEWDGTTWRAFTPIAISPRAYHAMAFDPVRQRVIVFGGQDAAGVRNDTWEWDGVRWAPLALAVAPGARADAGLAIDPTRGTLLLHGGRNDFDTWELRASTWWPVQSTPVPTFRLSSMAADPIRGRVVATTVLSPSGNSNWEWDGSVWSPRPSSSSGFAAYDSVHRAVVFAAWDRVELYGNVTAGASKWFGAGCGATPPPRLHAIGAPNVATDRFELEVLDMPPGSAVVFLLANAGPTWTLPGGCTLLAAPDLVATPLSARANAAGVARVRPVLPRAQVLVGTRFHAQAAAIASNNLVLSDLLFGRIGT